MEHAEALTKALAENERILELSVERRGGRFGAGVGAELEAAHLGHGGHDKEELREISTPGDGSIDALASLGRFPTVWRPGASSQLTAG